MLNEPLTTGEVARILRVGEQTVRRLVDEGALTATRASNGYRLYERHDVEAVAPARAARREGQDR